MGIHKMKVVEAMIIVDGDELGAIIGAVDADTDIYYAKSDSVKWFGGELKINKKLSKDEAEKLDQEFYNRFYMKKFNDIRELVRPTFKFFEEKGLVKEVKQDAAND